MKSFVFNRRIILLIIDQRLNERNTIRELESRLAELKMTLSHREQELNRLKVEEEQRIQFLRSAIVEYIDTGKN